MMIKAKRPAVERLLNDAESVLEHRRSHCLAISSDAQNLVSRIKLAISKADMKMVDVDPTDLSAIYDLAKSGEWIHGRRIMRFLETHAMASWLAAAPLAVINVVSQPFETCLLLISSPLWAAFLVYAYLPARLAAYTLSVIVISVRNRGTAELRNPEDWVLGLAAMTAIAMIPLLLPCWFIVRRFHTGRPAQSAWIAVRVILFLQVGYLVSR